MEIKLYKKIPLEAKQIRTKVFVEEQGDQEELWKDSREGFSNGGKGSIIHPDCDPQGSGYHQSFEGGLRNGRSERSPL